ncbi:hypothetical protein AZE42_01573 [Rhizopogon vesiculosus]|uniref:Uncharacterized protein n=1 Tax=Rhizopogon vesiculosus TaxID=180088 RepID=A0A1J8Q2W9_9AGAM|nr:hypothetical protein AZE42_01573 [Rhizopogon vesiculosus]
MIKHPYSAPSSYLYANRDDSYSQSSYVSPPPERLYSFMPRMSVDSIPWYGTTEYSATSSNKDYDQQDSLPIRSTLRERTRHLFKGVRVKVRNRWPPLRLGSLFCRPRHYDTHNDPGFVALLSNNLVML